MSALNRCWNIAKAGIYNTTGAPLTTITSPDGNVHAIRIVIFFTSRNAVHQVPQTGSQPGPTTCANEDSRPCRRDRLTKRVVMGSSARTRLACGCLSSLRPPRPRRSTVPNSMSTERLSNRNPRRCRLSVKILGVSCSWAGCTTTR